MAIKSLNEIYEKGALAYLCNACGDVNNPANPGDLGFYKAEDVMTPQELDLYEHYWTEDGGCYRYVLRVFDPEWNHEAAMGLGFLMDRSWCRDILAARRGKLSRLTDAQLDMTWMPKLFEALTKATETLIEPLVHGCDFYLGNQTDPDGHELLVVIPYDRRDEIEDICNWLNEKVYPAVESLF